MSLTALLVQGFSSSCTSPHGNRFVDDRRNIAPDGGVSGDLFELRHRPPRGPASVSSSNTNSWICQIQATRMFGMHGAEPTNRAIAAIDSRRLPGMQRWMHFVAMKRNSSRHAGQREQRFDIRLYVEQIDLVRFRAPLLRHHRTGGRARDHFGFARRRIADGRASNKRTRGC